MATAFQKTIPMQTVVAAVRRSRRQWQHAESANFHAEAPPQAHIESASLHVGTIRASRGALRAGLRAALWNEEEGGATRAVLFFVAVERITAMHDLDDHSADNNKTPRNRKISPKQGDRAGEAGTLLVRGC